MKLTYIGPLASGTVGDEHASVDFLRGKPVEVPDELAARILAGSEVNVDPKTGEKIREPNPDWRQESPPKKRADPA